MGTKCSKVQKDERHRCVYRTVSKSMWLRKEMHCGRVKRRTRYIKACEHRMDALFDYLHFLFYASIKFKSSNMVMFAH